MVSLDRTALQLTSAVRRNFITVHSTSLSSGAHVQGGDITDSRDNDNRRRVETLLAKYISDDAIVTLVLMARSAEGEAGPRTGRREREGERVRRSPGGGLI